MFEKAQAVVAAGQNLRELFWSLRTPLMATDHSVMTFTSAVANSLTADQKRALLNCFSDSLLSFHSENPEENLAKSLRRPLFDVFNKSAPIMFYDVIEISDKETEVQKTIIDTMNILRKGRFNMRDVVRNYRSLSNGTQISLPADVSRILDEIETKYIPELDRTLALTEKIMGLTPEEQNSHLALARNSRMTGYDHFVLPEHFFPSFL